jgi:hypothetical protein
MRIPAKSFQQPFGLRPQLFGVAAKHPPLKLVLTVDFHVVILPLDDFHEVSRACSKARSQSNG